MSFAKRQAAFLRNIAFSAFIAAGLVVPGTVRAEGDTPTDRVLKALSGFHVGATPDGLEQLAGGREALIAALLELRTNNQVPFVGIRAEKMLLSYAGRSDVDQALSADVNSTTNQGLARTVAMHLDRAPSAELRTSLSEQIVNRANREPGFAPFARALTQSSDPSVRAVARSLR